MTDHVSHESDSFAEIHWMKLITDYLCIKFHSELDNSSAWCLYIMLYFWSLLHEVKYNSCQFHLHQELVYKLTHWHSSLNQQSSFNLTSE